jgi:hypothetical protein
MKSAQPDMAGASNQRDRRFRRPAYSESSYLDYAAGWMPPEPKQWTSPERILRAAILERAVIDAEWKDRDAIEWIHGLVPSAPTFSCEDICDMLSIPVERVRALFPRPRPRRSGDARATLGRRLACRPDRG